jgi:hypothetical protein
MAARKGYTLEDFQCSMSASCPIEYASVADPELFAFDTLEIMNFLSGPQDVSMLRIGNCIVQHERNLVWAYSTPSSIVYYIGNLERECKLMPPHLQTTIDYGMPFMMMYKSVGWSEGVDEVVPMVKKQVMEAAINFAFLLTGRVKYVENVKGEYVLSNFLFACHLYYRPTFAGKPAPALPHLPRYPLPADLLQQAPPSKTALPKASPRKASPPQDPPPQQPTTLEDVLASISKAEAETYYDLTKVMSIAKNEFKTELGSIIATKELVWQREEKRLKPKYCRTTLFMGFIALKDQGIVKVSARMTAKGAIELWGPQKISRLNFRNISFSEPWSYLAENSGRAKLENLKALVAWHFLDKGLVKEIWVQKDNWFMNLYMASRLVGLGLGTLVEEGEEEEEGEEAGGGGEGHETTDHGDRASVVGVLDKAHVGER